MSFGGPNDFHCLDCGVDTNAIDEYYMVRGTVWGQAEPPHGPNGMLCIGCLEKRIGRTLQASDFSDHMRRPLWDLVGRNKSARLLNRLGDS